MAPDARRSLALRNVFTTSSKRQCGTPTEAGEDRGAALVEALRIPICSTAPGALHCTGSEVTNQFLPPFVRIELQWSQAKFTPGVVRIVLDGAAPATIPESIIASLKAREVAA